MTFKRMGILLTATALTVLPVAAQAKTVSVAAISGYFAQGFGVSIVTGLNKAKADLGINLKLIDTGNRALDYQEQFDNVAKSGQYDLVFVMGWELADALQKSHLAYPNQRFVFIDGVLDSKSMTYVNFSEEQGSFLVGALSGMLADRGSKIEGMGNSRTIGFVGGRDIPVIRNFLHGYEEGAKYVTPDVKVSSVFAGTFDDPAKGSELAMALYGQGADIVYNAAGPTGEGVLQASAAAGKYSVGVDVDQCAEAPGHVIGSMLKRGDIAVYDLIKDEVSGQKVEPRTYTFDVKSGGVELLTCPAVADKIPADVTAKLATVKAGIADGTIKITSLK